MPTYARFWKWCKRNPWLAAANIAAAVATTVLAIGSTIAAKVYYDKSEQIAEQAKKPEAIGHRDRARSSSSPRSSGPAPAGSASRSASGSTRLDALAEAAKIGRGLGLPAERFDRLRDEAIACMALPDMKPAGPPIRMPEGPCRVRFRRRHDPLRHPAPRWDGPGPPDGRRPGDRPVHREGRSRHLGFRLQPRWKVSGVPRSSRAVRSRSGTSTGGALCLRDPGPVSGRRPRFSPDSRRVAVAHDDGSLLVYDLKSGQPFKSWHGPAPAQDLAFRPDGKQIAVVYRESQPTCRILDADTGQQVRAISHSQAPDPSRGVPTARPWRSQATTRKSRSGTPQQAIAGATLEGATNGGLRAAFHPAGTLLASNGWEGRLRLWDAVLGRQILSLTDGAGPDFSRDGRIFVGRGNEFSPWQVDPAIEYRTLVHASNPPLNFARPSIHPDGRILAVGTDRGVVLWDLARGTELAFLPIGMAWHSMFDVSGDLLTNGSAGVLRWPIHIDPTSGELRIGPPRRLPLPGTDCAIAEDRTGRIVAVAGHSEAYVALGDRTITIGPLDDCRGVSVSPDGQWLATGNHQNGGVTIWRLPDGARVTKLPIEGGAGAFFSPDGKWLMTSQAACRLWEVGTWREVRQIEGGFCGFSPDGRLAVVQDASKVLGLVEIETGRTWPGSKAPTSTPWGRRLSAPMARAWS